MEWFLHHGQRWYDDLKVYGRFLYDRRRISLHFQLGVSTVSCQTEQSVVRPLRLNITPVSLVFGVIHSGVNVRGGAALSHTASHCSVERECRVRAHINQRSD